MLPARPASTFPYSRLTAYPKPTARPPLRRFASCPCPALSFVSDKCSQHLASKLPLPYADWAQFSSVEGRWKWKRAKYPKDPYAGSLKSSGKQGWIGVLWKQ